MKNLNYVVLLGGVILVSMALFLGCGDDDNPVTDTNRPPVISSVTSSKVTVDLTDTCTITCTASDPDGDNLTYAWTTDPGSINGVGSSVIWTSPNVGGAVSVVCEVSDVHGAAVTDSITIMVTRQMPTQGLIAYYPFAGNANDESGNAIHCTVIGPVLSSDRHGNDNSAYSFDGQDDYIKANASKLPSNERTISIWFYANSVENRPGLLGYGGLSSTRGTTWFMGLNVRGWGSFHMQCHWDIDRIDYYYANPPVGDWYHFVVTTENSGTKIYVNGAEKASNATFVDDTYVNDRELGIGVISSTNGIVPYTDTNVTYFEGLIDDIRIYDRALSIEEVVTLFLEGQ